MNGEKTKLCPFRFGGEEGTSVRCVGEMCAVWANGECAIAKIAKSIGKENNE